MARSDALSRRGLFTCMTTVQLDFLPEWFTPSSLNTLDHQQPSWHPHKGSYQHTKVHGKTKKGSNTLNTFVNLLYSQHRIKAKTTSQTSWYFVLQKCN